MATSTHLPEQVTNFIGREVEIETVKSLLATYRLVTLTGTGGTGKTRLALRVARDVGDRYPDGVWFVDLSPLSDPALVPQAVAATLKMRKGYSRDLTARLAAYLEPRQLLIVLDNCEHLAEACADLLSLLLRACPHLRVLATSRRSLGISGEYAWRVPPFALPEQGDHLSIEVLERCESVALFMESARRKRHDFSLTSHNAEWVAHLCRRLDGLPLAIELAAAWVRTLSVQQIATYLDDRFRLLRGGDPTAPPRHQTLQSLFDWSYDLLSDRERILFRAVSVFSGGFTLDGLQAIVASEDMETRLGPSHYEVLDLLASLVDKSLVIAEAGGISGEVRYRLLETARQYAAERLREAGEMPVMRSRHARWCLALAERMRAEMLGPNQWASLERLEMEQDNFRTALDWCAQHPADLQTGLGLGSALLRFWEAHGHFTEGRDRLTALLSLSQSIAGAEHDCGTVALAGALNAAGRLAWRQADYVAATDLLGQALSMYEQLGERRGVAHALNNLGNVVYFQGDYKATLSLYEESLATFREIGDRWGVAQLLHNLALIPTAHGDYASARALISESLALRQQLGDRYSIAQSLISLGEISRATGGYVAAQPLYEESLAIFREFGDERNVAYVLDHLGHVALVQGDAARAEALFSESLTIFNRLGERFGIAINLTGLAGVARAWGSSPEEVRWQATRAATLFGAAQALFSSTSARLDPVDETEYNRNLEAARSTLNSATWDAAWQVGRSMPLARAVEYALQGSSGATQGVTPPTRAGDEPSSSGAVTSTRGENDLTKREVDTLRLVAAGLTNIEVGDRLSVSPRTVQSHLRSIYSKLDVTTRSAATRYAVEHGLV